ncbi:MAG: DUF5702 domain-containing protein [Clostridium sp.]
MSTGPGMESRIQEAVSSGLSYLSWLKILLFVEPLVRQEYRIMDVIELNLGQGKQRLPDAERVCIRCRCRGQCLWEAPVSFSPAFVENLTGNRD